MTRTFLVFIFLIFSYIELSFLTYYFQIKEYRFDRLISFLREKGILYFLFPEKIYLPKKSVRNRNIFIIHTLIVLSYFIFTFTFFKNIPLLICALMLTPVITVLTVIVGVLYTGTIVKRKRGDIIKQASDMIKESKAVFIGVTGSFGKTSTKEFLYKILSSSFKVGKTDENQNTDIGVAMSVTKNLKEDTDYFIFEVGAYKIGEIRDIVHWIKPTFGILTGLGNQHLSLFGSQENLIKAKSELLEVLPNDGCAYINKDCLGYEKVLDTVKCRSVLYSGTDSNADVFIKKYTKPPTSDSFDVTISCGGEDINFVSDLIGRHNIVNLLPCIALSLDLGIKKDVVKEELESLDQVIGKLSTHIGLNGAKFLNDSYSSNVDGFLSAIDVVQQIKGGKKIIITKGVIELGKDMESSYKKILNASNKDNLKILTTDRFLKKLDTNSTVSIFRSEKTIFNYLKKEVGKEDIILIEGRFSGKFLSKLELK